MRNIRPCEIMLDIWNCKTFEPAPLSGEQIELIPLLDQSQIHSSASYAVYHPLLPKKSQILHDKTL